MRKFIILIVFLFNILISIGIPFIFGISGKIIGYGFSMMFEGMPYYIEFVIFIFLLVFEFIIYHIFFDKDK